MQEKGLEFHYYPMDNHEKVLECLKEEHEHKTVPIITVNIDGNEVRSESNKFEFFELNNLKILLTHISGKTPKYNKETLIKIKEHNPNLLIAGHSHILKIQYDKINQLIFLNPGAAGRHGFHLKRTMLRFEIKLNNIENLEIIELGSRSDLS